MNALVLAGFPGASLAPARSDILVPAGEILPGRNGRSICCVETPTFASGVGK